LFFVGGGGWVEYEAEKGDCAGVLPVL
jgi:hypothetical protein